MYGINQQRTAGTIRSRLMAALSLGLLSLLLVAAILPGEVYAQQRRVVVVDDSQPALDAKTREAIIDAVTKTLNEEYVFPEVAQKMEAHVRQKLGDGAYERVAALHEFTELLTRDLRSICHDRHLGVRVEEPRPTGAPARDEEEEAKRRLEELRSQNFGFKKLELLPGNIGYVDLRMFAHATHGGDTAVAAMNFLAHCDAIIFDLRRNGGGSPSMIQLITSYFYEEPVHLNSFYIRHDDSTKQFWTQSRVQGSRLSDVPIYVLTSRRTFSGAEEFTYNLKNLERATIIGETTGGGAHPVNFRRFDELNVSMSVPFGRAINPITGTNWEGTGIEPHIAVPAAEALEVARIEAMKALLAKETDETRRAELEWAVQGLEAQNKPLKLTATDLKSYVGDFGPRSIRLEKGHLVYKRGDQPQHRMIPMGQDLFGIDDIDYFRIRFDRDSSGTVTKLIGLYDNGHSDFHERSGS